MLLLLNTFIALVFIASLPYDVDAQQGLSRFEEQLASPNFISITSNKNGLTTNIISHQFQENSAAAANDNVNSNRITSGDLNHVFDKASAKEFPWMVSIEASFVKYYQCSPTWNWSHSFNMITNGVLINNQWILTAASGLYWNGNATVTPCNNTDYQEIYEYPLVNQATLILGALNMSNSNPGSNPIVPSEPQRVVMYSRLILPHPDFKFEELEGTSLLSDLALIRLPNPIEFNEFTRPIKLPNGVGNITMINFTMVSYGVYEAFDGSNINAIIGRGELRKVGVLGQPNHECQPIFPNSQLINDSYYVTCVAGPGFAYWGDQGAAMIHRNGNNQEENNWTLAAMASKVNFYARSYWPAPNSAGFSVGVKVEPHLDWIDSVVNDDSISQPPIYPATPLYTTTTSTNRPTTNGAGMLLLSILGLSRMITLTAIFILLLN